jgi:glycosyltransferase involved in cell wall biosynthesis
MKIKKIAYIINHISFFDSHISPIAISAQNNYKVKLFCGNSASKVMDRISVNNVKKNKIEFSKFGFQSSGLNILAELIGLIKLFIAIKKFKPDLIHCATPKGILFGGIIARILNIKSLLIFNTGMGFLYTNKLSFLQKISLNIFVILQKYIFKHKNKKIIIENRHDLNFLAKKFLIKKKEFILITAGSGVDLNKFKKINILKNKLVLVPSRVVKEKGIIEFVSAAKILKKKYKSWQFCIAGSTDYIKQSSFTANELNDLKKKKFINFLGYQQNILKYYKKSSIICLPSYREGLSKSLIEAAALGIPVVTTNVVGCRDAILPGITGEICKVKDVKSLSDKLEILILDKKKRSLYGTNARKFAEREYGLDKVINKNLNTYNILFQNV